MAEVGGRRRELITCGACWPRRGSKRVFESLADLERHATQVHPDLGYIPVKRLVERR